MYGEPVRGEAASDGACFQGRAREFPFFVRRTADTLETIRKFPPPGLTPGWNKGIISCRKGLLMMRVFFGSLLTSLLLISSVAAAEDDIVAKHWDARAVAEPEETIPDDVEGNWGKWHFWNGQWWARAMFQPEAAGPSWDAPKNGLSPAWNRLKGVWLRARRKVPSEAKDARILLSQNGIRGCTVIVFVNRTKAGEISAPAGELEITKFVKIGAENEFHLLLAGKNHDFKLEKDPPFLLIKPPVSVDDVFADTSWRGKKLTVETEVTVPKDCKAVVRAEVFDADGKKVKSLRENVALKAGSNVVRPSVKWENPIAWELGRGYLYTLKTSVEIGGKSYPYKDVRFGFREIWREGRKIFMNGHEQKFRVTYNFGCNRYGAKMLTNIGYNTIQFAHRTELDPSLDEGDLLYFSQHGIGAIEPMCAFDWNTKGPLLKPGEKREAFKAMQAKNLKRYRNWPCIVMMYMGVNAYLPQWSYDAQYLGCGDQNDFAKMMEDLVAAAKKTNPNVLYYSHSDGSTGEIASANLYFNWVPMQEREDWPSRWAEEGKFPFQAAEFGHPYELSWFRGGRDLVTELCAIYYGDKAYETEPFRLARNHKAGIWLGRVQHPMTRELQKDFAWRVTRAWRTFGINAGIVWFNLDTGFGMPGWPMEKVWDGYPQPAYNFFKSEAEVPKGRPDWALPYWDIYAKGNQDFLGWIAGFPRITDRRHAYNSGEKIVKRNVMMWDRFDSRSFSAEWKATLDGKEIARGTDSAKLVSNVPHFADIAFEAPSVKRKTSGTVTAVYRDASGEEIARDSLPFEVYPPAPISLQKVSSVKRTLAVYDPANEIGDALKSVGFDDFRQVASPKDAKGSDALVIAPYSLKSSDELPREEITKGLRVLVFSQPTGLYQKAGFDVEDVAPRQLFARDFGSRYYRGLSDDDLRDWYGQPRTDQEKKYGCEPFGHLTKKGNHGPRWNYNMALGGLVIRTPDIVGYLPAVEGEFDGNYAGVLRQCLGEGEIVWTTLSPFGRFATNELKGEPVRDAAAERTAVAMLADLLWSESVGATRQVKPVGAYAKRLADEVGCVVDDGKASGKESVILAGPDADVSGAKLLAAAKNGANVLVMGNVRLAKELGLKVEPCAASPSGGVFRVTHDRKNPDLRAIGANLLHFRDAYDYDKLVGGTDWSVDAEGMFAAKTLKNGAKIYVTQYETFKLEDRIATEKECFRFGKIEPVTDKQRKDNLRKCDVTFERARQFAARLLTVLGASGTNERLYRGLTEDVNPYIYNYW